MQRSLGADAKRKKKKKKRQQGSGKNLKFSDWNDVWFTELDNGVTGIATFEGADQNGLYGTYENEVGSGTLRCYMQGDVKAPCHGFYTQYSDGTSGSITMTLHDKNHWSGTYQIDGGSNGTWSGETIQF